MFSIPIKSKNKNRTLAVQLISFLFFFLLIIFIISVLITYSMVSSVMLANAQESTSNLVHGKVQIIDKELSKIMTLGRDLQNLINDNLLSDTDLQNYIQHLLEDNLELAAVSIAPDPDGKSAATSYMINRGDLKSVILSDPGFRYKEWYQIPYLTDNEFWTDPWFDQFGTGKVICSYALPMQLHSQKIGILRLDILMDDLHKIILPIRVKRTGYAFLLSYNGTVIAHPSDSLAMNYTIFDIAEIYQDSKLRQISKNILAKKTGFVKLKANNYPKEHWMFYEPLPSNQWALVIVVSEKEVLRDLRTILLVFILTSLLTFISIAFIIYKRTHAINRPLEQLVNLIKRAGSGDFSEDLPPSPPIYEIQALTEAYEYMISSLKDYISNLKKVTEEKNRIVNEIIFASEIQRNLIPGNNNPALKFDEISAFGILDPAGDIGGDLYDYFRIDDHYFCFGVADVVGKGIAAAMTMTIISTLLRTIAVKYIEPHEILKKLNHFLMKNNLESNFVTITLGIIDLRNGKTVFSNAGHVPWVLLKNDGQIVRFSNTHSTALGFFDILTCNSETTQIDPGDKIILITDGITEAMDPMENLFGIDGLENVLRNLENPHPETTALSILTEVKHYTGQDKQKDDISILVLEYLRNTIT